MLNGNLVSIPDFLSGSPAHILLTINTGNPDTLADPGSLFGLAGEQRGLHPSQQTNAVNAPSNLPLLGPPGSSTTAPASSIASTSTGSGNVLSRILSALLPAATAPTPASTPAGAAGAAVTAATGATGNAVANFLGLDPKSIQKGTRTLFFGLLVLLAIVIILAQTDQGKQVIQQVKDTAKKGTEAAVEAAAA